MQGHKTITSLTLVFLFIGFFISVNFYHSILKHLPGIAYAFMLFWLAAAIIFALLSYRHFVSFFLLCLFSMMIAWRIAGLYDVTIVSFILLVAFIGLFCNFIYCAYTNMHNPLRRVSLSLAEWQLIFVRLYIGFDFIPHFTEKLFAGSPPHMADVIAFTHLGVPYPDFFVWLAGLCEFGSAVALGLGFIMRLGAVGAALYLFIATYLGHHFSLGFIWAGEGGGWEFPTMWIVLVLTFAITGINSFSIDQELEKRFNIPKFLKKLM